MSATHVLAPVPKPRRAHVQVATATEQLSTEHTDLEKSQELLNSEDQFGYDVSPTAPPPRPLYPPIPSLEEDNFYDDNPPQSSSESESEGGVLSHSQEYSEEEEEEGPGAEGGVVIRQRTGMPPPSKSNLDDEDDDYENIDAHLDEHRLSEVRRSDYINWVYMGDDEEEGGEGEGEGQDGGMESSLRPSREPPSVKLKNHPVLKKSQSSSFAEPSASDYEMFKRLRPKNRAPPPPPGGSSGVLKKQQSEDRPTVSASDLRKHQRHKRSTSDLNLAQHQSPVMSRQSSGGALKPTGPPQIRALSPANRPPPPPPSGSPHGNRAARQSGHSPDAGRHKRSHDHPGTSPKQQRRAGPKDAERSGVYAPLKAKDGVDPRSRGGHVTNQNKTEAKGRQKKYHRVAIRSDGRQDGGDGGRPTAKGYSRVAIKERPAEGESKPTVRGYSKVVIKMDDGIYERFTRPLKSQKQSDGAATGDVVYDKLPKTTRTSQDKPPSGKTVSHGGSHDPKQEATPTVKPKRHAPPPPTTRKSSNSSPEGLAEGESPRETDTPPSAGHEDTRPPKPQRRKRAGTDDMVKESLPVSSSALSSSSGLDSSSILANLDLFTITLHRGGAGLGLAIVNGKARSSQGEVVEGIFVQKVLPDSVADKDGRIQSGDMLVEAGGSNMVGGSLGQAMAVLTAPADSITLKIGRPDVMSSVFATEGEEEQPIYVNRLCSSDQTELLAKVEAAELRIAELEAERERALSETEALREQADRERDSLQQQLEEKQREFDQHKSETGQTVIDLTETLASVSVEKTKAEKQVEIVRQEAGHNLEELKQQLQQTQAQVKDLREKLLTTENKLSSAEELVSSQALDVERVRMASEFDKERVKMASEFDKERVRMASEFDKERVKLSLELDKEKAKIEAKLSQEQANNKDLLATIAKQAIQIRDLKLELATLSSSTAVAVAPVHSSDRDTEPASNELEEEGESILNHSAAAAEEEEEEEGTLPVVDLTQLEEVEEDEDTVPAKPAASPYVTYVPLNDVVREDSPPPPPIPPPPYSEVVESTPAMFSEFDAVQPTTKLDHSHMLHKSRVAGFRLKRKPSRELLRSGASSPALLETRAPDTSHDTTKLQTQDSSGSDSVPQGKPLSQESSHDTVQPLLPPKPKPRAAPRKKPTFSTPVESEARRPHVTPRHQQAHEDGRPTPSPERGGERNEETKTEGKKELPRPPVKKPAAAEEHSEVDQMRSPEKQKKKELPPTPSQQESPKIKKKDPILPSPRHKASNTAPSSDAVESNHLSPEVHAKSSDDPPPPPAKPVGAHKRNRSGADIDMAASDVASSKDPSELTIKEKAMLAKRAFESSDEKPRVPPPVLKKPTKSTEALSTNEMARSEIESSPLRERAKSLDNELDTSPRRRMKLPPGAFNMGLHLPPLPGKMERDRSTTISTDEPPTRSGQPDSTTDDTDGSQRTQENGDTPSNPPQEIKSVPPKRPPPPMQKKPSNEKPSPAQSSPKRQQPQRPPNREGGGATTSDSDASPQIPRSDTRESCDLAETEPPANPVPGVLGQTPERDGVDLSCILTWTPDAVGAWLVTVGLGQYQQLFIERGVQGYMMFDYDGARLKGMGMSSQDDRGTFKKEVKSLKPYADRHKKILDKQRKDDKKQAKRKKKFV